MYEFYYYFLLIKSTWDIASAAIGLVPKGRNLSKIYIHVYIHKRWTVEWAMWAGAVGLATG